MSKISPHMISTNRKVKMMVAHLETMMNLKTNKSKVKLKPLSNIFPVDTLEIAMFLPVFSI
jgi:hypothetical protein